MIGSRVARPRPRTGGSLTYRNWKEAEVTSPMKKVDRVKHSLTELRNRKEVGGTSLLSMRKSLRSSRSSWPPPKTRNVIVPKCFQL